MRSKRLKSQGKSQWLLVIFGGALATIIAGIVLHLLLNSSKPDYSKQNANEDGAFKKLIGLKVEVLALYETFTFDSVDTNKIATINLRFAQMSEEEYWKGANNTKTAKKMLSGGLWKGGNNIETWEQIRIIQQMFKRHIDDRIKNGKWSEAHLNNSKQNIAEAFDIALNTQIMNCPAASGGVSMDL